MKHYALALVFIAAAATAQAQDVDARWKPWLGCWQVTGGDAEVCITSDGANAVTLTTRVARQPDFTQTIVADAALHPLTDGNCTGTQRAEWSSDGRRLFAHANVTCKQQPSRAISGISLMTAEDAWLDVQAIETDGRTSVRVRRYQRGSPLAPSRPRTLAPSHPRTLAPSPFTLDAVKEAAGKVAPEALEAALSETDSRFALNSRVLIDLDDARVPDSVIDVMVALSYPEKFQVERRTEAAVGFPSMSSLGPFDTGDLGFWGLGYPYFSAYYDYFGYYRYYASPFGWVYPYGYFGPYLSTYDNPRRPVEGGTTTTATDDARVVNGVGYTRIRPREAQRTESSSEGRSSGTSTGRATAGSSGYSSGSSSSSSGSTSSAPASSSGSSGERTAQPR